MACPFLKGTGPTVRWSVEGSLGRSFEKAWEKLIWDEPFPTTLKKSVKTHLGSARQPDRLERFRTKTPQEAPPNSSPNHLESSLSGLLRAALRRSAQLDQPRLSKYSRASPLGPLNATMRNNAHHSFLNRPPTGPPNPARQTPTHPCRQLFSKSKLRKALRINPNDARQVSPTFQR